MQVKQLTKSNTEIIKGLGILLIIFHNYFHWVPPNTGGNEFTFKPIRIQNLFLLIYENPLEIINISFGFFGHYGVQLFIFLSGYGLTKSFLKKHNSPYRYILKKILKIETILAIGTITLISYKTILLSNPPNLDWCIKIIYKFLMIHTILPNESLSLNGPWWFFGLIFQLYLFFIPLLIIIKKWKIKALIICTILHLILFYSTYNILLDNNIYFLANGIGHIPEFSFGIFLALNKNTHINKPILLTVIILFIMGNIYFVFFPLTFISFIIIFIYINSYFKLKNKTVKCILSYYGTISLYLFAIHGFLRNPYFVNNARGLNSPLTTILLGVLFLFFSTLVSQAIKSSYTVIQNQLIKN